VKSRSIPRESYPRTRQPLTRLGAEESAASFRKDYEVLGVTIAHAVLETQVYDNERIFDNMNGIDVALVRGQSTTLNAVPYS
jgi:hypothetical protein